MSVPTIPTNAATIRTLGAVAQALANIPKDTVALVSGPAALESRGGGRAWCCPMPSDTGARAILRMLSGSADVTVNAAAPAVADTTALDTERAARVRAESHAAAMERTVTALREELDAMRTTGGAPEADIDAGVLERLDTAEAGRIQAEAERNELVSRVETLEANAACAGIELATLRAERDSMRAELDALRRKAEVEALARDVAVAEERAAVAAQVAATQAAAVRGPVVVRFPIGQQGMTLRKAGLDVQALKGAGFRFRFDDVASGGTGGEWYAPWSPEAQRIADQCAVSVR